MILKKTGNEGQGFTVINIFSAFGIYLTDGKFDFFDSWNRYYYSNYYFGIKNFSVRLDNKFGSFVCCFYFTTKEYSL